MVRTAVIFIVILVYIDCALAYKVDSLGKCSIKDGNCLSKMYNAVILEAAESGITEIGIPVFDPYLFKNVEITVLELVKIGSPEAVVKGLKNCAITKLDPDLANKVASVTYNCKLITVDGTYYVQTTPVANIFLGSIKIHGEGNGELKIENVQIDAEVPLIIKKLSDSEMHFVIQGNNITYKYQVFGKVSITADNLFIGSQEVSNVAVNIVNENWEQFVKLAGDSIIRKCLDVFEENANKILAATPIKDMILEDLSSYAT